jgi:hypothetical protein
VIPTGAPSPRGKAEVCKTSTPGSNPGGASNFPEEICIACTSDAQSSSRKFPKWASDALVADIENLLPGKAAPSGAAHGLRRRHESTLRDYEQEKEYPYATRLKQAAHAASHGLVDASGTTRAIVVNLAVSRRQSMCNQPPVGTRLGAVLSATAGAVADDVYRCIPVAPDVGLASLDAGRRVHDVRTAYVSAT